MRPISKSSKSKLGTRGTSHHMCGPLKASTAGERSQNFSERKLFQSDEREFSR